MRFAAILLGASLLGCAAPTVWYKEGATAQDFKTAAYECERDARQSRTYGLVDSILFQDDCMQAHGFSHTVGDGRTITPVGGRWAACDAMPEDYLNCYNKVTSKND